MDKFKSFLSAIPSWILTIITALLILWLTLVPDPLGDDSPDLFPGADKVVHAIMFGFFTVMVLLDRQRKIGWVRMTNETVVLAVFISSFFGIDIEFAQLAMGLGRGFEVADMIADVVGASLCGLAWAAFQDRWINK